MLDPGSYLPEYFTEERLEHLRSLQKEFPMWCGSWPLSIRDLMEYEPWRPLTRVTDHAALGDSRPVLLHTEMQPSLHYIPEVVPAFWRRPSAGANWRAPRVLLSAMHYACQPWHRSDFGEGRVEAEWGPEPMLSRWSDLIRWALEVPPDEVLASVERHFGLELAQQRQAVLRSKGSDRTRLKKELVTTWTELGESIGVISKIARGTVLQLRGESLERLLSEGAALVEAATDFVVPDEEMRRVRDVVQGTEPLDFRSLELIASLMRNEQVEQADRIREEKQRVHLDDAEIGILARWLRFPILNREEIEEVVVRPTRDSDECYSLARDFILRRWESIGLKLTPDAIRKALQRAADAGGVQRPA